MGSGADCGARGAAGVTKSLCKNPPAPGSRSGGVRSSAPVAEDFGGGGCCESSEREQGPPGGHPHALGPRSGHQPADPRRAPASPQQFLPPPHFNKQGSLASQPRQVSESLHPTPSSPNKRPRPHPQPRPPRCPRGAPSSHPATKLTRPGVFLRSFSCSPRRLSRGGQLCSLHLPVRSPPFFTSPEIA